MFCGFFADGMVRLLYIGEQASARGGDCAHLRYPNYDYCRDSDASDSSRYRDYRPLEGIMLLSGISTSSPVPSILVNQIPFVPWYGPSASAPLAGAAFLWG